MKKITASDRNKQIEDYFESLFSSNSINTQFFEPFLISEVESLFNTHIYGHREIILTILAAMHVNPRFKASKNFYACHPRSIYENPLRSLLLKYGIPHKKSGPLNVAKNIDRINSDWASGKDGGDIAQNVVRIVQKLEKIGPEDIRDFTEAYIHRYKQEAEKIKELEIIAAPEEDPILIAKLLIDTIDNIPDGGATPQFFVGKIIELLNQFRESNVAVEGHLDSVSSTNTTSKKAGDIVEILSKDTLVYEVTVKEFSQQRMIDSYQSVKDSGSTAKDVYVICRKKDVPSALEVSNNYLMANTSYNDINYFFLNINDFIQSSLVLLSASFRRKLLTDVVRYVNEINTSEELKTYFKKKLSEEVH